MSPHRVLSLAQAALHTPNGAAKALRYLEEETRRSSEIGGDAGVWACIAHLRRKQGDSVGGDDAECMAREVADSDVARRRLSFEEVGEVGEGGVGGRVGDVAVESVRERRIRDGKEIRCRELFEELGIRVDAVQGKRERLLERTRRLRMVSEGLLRDVELG